MYKYLVALLIALSSLVAFAHEHGNAESEKQTDEQTEKQDDKNADKKDAEPAKIQYEDPKKYYPKK